MLTPLLAGRAVQMSGQHYRVQQEPSVPPGVKSRPVLVAALEPQMLRLAGELADGTALAPSHGPSLTRSRPDPWDSGRC